VLIVSPCETQLKEKTMNTFASIAGAVAMLVLCAAPSRAQDPATTDPAHFKVELNNDRVRVLHVTVEPNTKVDLHEVGDAVVVPLTDYESTLKRPDGQTSVVERKTGKAAWVARGAREFEAGAKGVDALLIEIKHAP
jgi:translation initiation factor IF-1